MGIFRRKDQDTVIDLTAMEREASTSSAPARVWGLPEPCPACGDPGYLDKIDLNGEIMYQHCPTCLHKWETTRAEVETASA